MDLLINTPSDFSLLICCCGSRGKVEDEERTTMIDQESSNVCFLFQPLEFEVEDYVLDLTYTQTLCWSVNRLIDIADCL